MNEDSSAGSEIPPNEAVLKKDDSWLAISILIVAGIAALIIGYRMLRSKSSDAKSGNSVQRSSFTPPTERQNYIDARKSLKPSDPFQNDELKKLLMKRALQTIPILISLQSEGSSIERLYKKGILTDDMHFKVKELKAYIDQEMQDIQTEADELLEGWGQVIWSQAMQFYRLVQQQTETKQPEAKEPEENKKASQKKKSKKSGNKESAPSEITESVKQEPVKAEPALTEEEIKEKEAAKFAQQLIEEEEREKQKKQGDSKKKANKKK